MRYFEELNQSQGSYDVIPEGFKRLVQVIKSECLLCPVAVCKLTDLDTNFPREYIWGYHIS